MGNAASRRPRHAGTAGGGSGGSGAAGRARQRARKHDKHGRESGSVTGDNTATPADAGPTDAHDGARVSPHRNHFHFYRHNHENGVHANAKQDGRGGNGDVSNGDHGGYEGRHRRRRQHSRQRLHRQRCDCQKCCRDHNSHQQRGQSRRGARRHHERRHRPEPSLWRPEPARRTMIVRFLRLAGRAYVNSLMSLRSDPTQSLDGSARRGRRMHQSRAERVHRVPSATSERNGDAHTSPGRDRGRGSVRGRHRGCNGGHVVGGNDKLAPGISNARLAPPSIYGGDFNSDSDDPEETAFTHRDCAAAVRTDSRATWRSNRSDAAARGAAQQSCRTPRDGGNGKAGDTAATGPQRRRKCGSANEPHFDVARPSAGARLAQSSTKPTTTTATSAANERSTCASNVAAVPASMTPIVASEYERAASISIDANAPVRTRDTAGIATTSRSATHSPLLSLSSGSSSSSASLAASSSPSRSASALSATASVSSSPTKRRGRADSGACLPVAPSGAAQLASATPATPSGATPGKGGKAGAAVPLTPRTPPPPPPPSSSSSTSTTRSPKSPTSPHRRHSFSVHRSSGLAVIEVCEGSSTELRPGELVDVMVVRAPPCGAALTASPRGASACTPSAPFASNAGAPFTPRGGAGARGVARGTSDSNGAVDDAAPSIVASLSASGINLRDVAAEAKSQRAHRRHYSSWLTNALHRQRPLSIAFKRLLVVDDFGTLNFRQALTNVFSFLTLLSTSSMAVRSVLLPLTREYNANLADLLRHTLDMSLRWSSAGIPLHTIRIVLPLGYCTPLVNELVLSFKHDLDERGVFDPNRSAQRTLKKASEASAARGVEAGNEAMRTARRADTECDGEIADAAGAAVADGSRERALSSSSSSERMERRVADNELVGGAVDDASTGKAKRFGAGARTSGVTTSTQAASSVESAAHRPTARSELNGTIGTATAMAVTSTATAAMASIEAPARVPMDKDCFVMYNTDDKKIAWELIHLLRSKYGFKVSDMHSHALMSAAAEAAEAAESKAYESLPPAPASTSRKPTPPTGPGGAQPGKNGNANGISSSSGATNATVGNENDANDNTAADSDHGGGRAGGAVVAAAAAVAAAATAGEQGAQAAADAHQAYLVDQWYTALLHSRRVIAIVSDTFFRSPQCSALFSQAACRNAQHDGETLCMLLWQSADLPVLARRLCASNGVDCRERDRASAIRGVKQMAAAYSRSLRAEKLASAQGARVPCQRRAVGGVGVGGGGSARAAGAPVRSPPGWESGDDGKAGDADDSDVTVQRPRRRQHRQRQDASTSTRDSTSLLKARRRRRVCSVDERAGVDYNRGRDAAHAAAATKMTRRSSIAGDDSVNTRHRSGSQLLSKSCSPSSASSASKWIVADDDGDDDDSDSDDGDGDDDNETVWEFYDDAPIMFKRAWRDKWDIPFSEVELGAKLGSGAFGDVYMATWRNCVVALKQLTRGDDGFTLEVVEDFQKEMHLLSTLEHPNIVRFHGAVTHPPNLCILLGFISGGSLYKRIHARDLHDEGPFPVHEMARLALGVARAMQYLHAQSPPVVHRDLKSPNVLIDADSGEPVVTDFGLSRSRAKTMLLTGAAGTPEWMAPEIMRNESVDERSDVFSYGVVVWELVTCRRPWAGEHPIQVIFRVAQRHESLTLPDGCNPNVRTLVEACLRPRPRQRPEFADIVQFWHEFIAQLTAGGQGGARDDIRVGGGGGSNSEVEGGE